MIRIAGITINGNVNYIQGEHYAEVVLRIVDASSITEEELSAIKNATELEEYVVAYGVEGDTGSQYALLGWRRVEKTWDGALVIAWQTYRATDIETLRQDNEDLTQALLELAEIVGGGNG